MTSEQKTIKNLAIALAWVLVIMIIVSAVSAVTGILGLLSLLDRKDTVISGELVSAQFDPDEIDSLSIDLRATEFEIVTGDTLKVDTTNNRISVRQSGKKLIIEEREQKLFEDNEATKTTVYLPADKEFKELELDTGAGSVTVEKISVEKLELDLGAGEVVINEMTVSGSADIDGGVGRFELRGGSISDLDLDLGVGKTEISASLTGRADIDTGIGNFDLELIGNRDDYKIQANKGLGSFSIDGTSVTDGQTIGNGTNIIQIDTGIGSANVTFAE